MMQRVLIVTGGLAPAVVTETVWALVKIRKPAFWPEKLFVIVTADAKRKYDEALLGPDGKLALLSRELGLPDLSQSTVVVATQCPDIRSEYDAIEFGDKVCEVVQRETAATDSMVHLSLAGGRKTMSFHGGAALSLFGRPQDELSHVLVNPVALEGCPDFWWPTQVETWLEHRDHTTTDGKPKSYNAQFGDGLDRARIELALIPFLRVRRRLTEPMLSRPMRYADYVTQANAAIEGRAGVVLELIDDTCELRIAGVADPIKLEPQQFCVYRVLAEWAKGQVSGCGARGFGAHEKGWISLKLFEDAAVHRDHGARNPVARLIELKPNLQHVVTASPQNDTQRADNLKFLRPIISTLRAKLWDAVVDADLGLRLMSAPAGSRKSADPVRVGISLAPEEISILAGDGGPELPPFVRQMHTDALG